MDSFAGPFDLLCTVLLRRELALADVDLVEVVIGYVQRLSMVNDDEVDADSASEFLILVAALMEIKVRELLSSGEDDDLVIELPALEARDELLERLIRYATYRNASRWLGERASVPRHWRTASLPVVRRTPVYDGPNIDPAVLARAIKVLLSAPDVDIRHLVGRHMSVQELAGRLVGAIRSKGTVSLDQFVDGLSRLDQAVALVAVLELCRTGEVLISQNEPFGDITVQQHEHVGDQSGRTGWFGISSEKSSEVSTTESQIA